MEKAKRRYKVYRTVRYDYCGMGVDSETTELAGETWAVSDKKAASNVAYRCGERTYDVIPLWGDGAKTTFYHAEEVVKQ